MLHLALWRDPSPPFTCHSVNKPLPKQRSMSSLHNLHWFLLLSFRSAFFSLEVIEAVMHTVLLVITLAKACRAIPPVILHHCHHTDEENRNWQMCEFMKRDTEAQKQWYSSFAVASPKPCDVGKKRTSLSCLLISCPSVAGCQIEERCEDECRLFNSDSGVHSCHFPVHRVSVAGYPQASVGVCLYLEFHFRIFLRPSG